MDELSVNSVIEYILKHHKPEIEEKFKFSEDIDELHYVAQVTMMLIYLKGSEPTEVEVDIVCGCMLKAIEDAKKKILNIMTIKTISHGLIEIGLN